jgi:hypothetical protein
VKKARLLAVLGNLAVLAAGLAVLFGLPAFAETYLIINSTIFARRRSSGWAATPMP